MCVTSVFFWCRQDWRTDSVENPKSIHGTPFRKVDVLKKWKEYQCESFREGGSHFAICKINMEHASFLTKWFCYIPLVLSVQDNGWIFVFFIAVWVDWTTTNCVQPLWMPGGVIVGVSGLCCCGLAFTVWRQLFESNYFPLFVDSTWKVVNDFVCLFAMLPDAPIWPYLTGR